MNAWFEEFTVATMEREALSRTLAGWRSLIEGFKFKVYAEKTSLLLYLHRRQLPDLVPLTMLDVSLDAHAPGTEDGLRYCNRIQDRCYTHFEQCLVSVKLTDLVPPARFDVKYDALVAAFGKRQEDRFIYLGIGGNSPAHGNSSVRRSLWVRALEILNLERHFRVEDRPAGAFALAAVNASCGVECVDSDPHGHNPRCARLWVGPDGDTGRFTLAALEALGKPYEVTFGGSLATDRYADAAAALRREAALDSPAAVHWTIVALGEFERSPEEYLLQAEPDRPVRIPIAEWTKQEDTVQLDAECSGQAVQVIASLYGWNKSRLEKAKRALRPDL